MSYSHITIGVWLTFLSNTRITTCTTNLDLQCQGYTLRLTAAIIKHTSKLPSINQHCFHNYFKPKEINVYSVNKTLIIEDTIKKSRFIGIIIPCQSESEALQHLTLLHQQYPDASHIVFAYRILTTKGIVMRFHDAGEPSGTAGKPVFQHLEGKDLINILCVVIRYFGGVKLGAGGLTRAYSNTAKKTIENSIISEHIEYVEIKQEIDYKQLQLIEYQLEKLNGVIIKQDFSDKINLLIRIPENNLPDLKVILERINRGF